MGAWGVGVFENDAVADWAGDFDDSPDADEFMRRTFSSSPDDGEDVVQPEAVIAAAAVVAALLADGPPFDDSYGPQTRPDLDLDLIPLAIQALDDVTSNDGDWADLWEDAELLPEAQATIIPIRAALAAKASS